MYGTSLLRINYTVRPNQIVAQFTHMDSGAQKLRGIPQPNWYSLPEIWPEWIFWTWPKTEESKCHHGDPNNVSDIWAYFGVGKRQIWNHAHNCVADKKKKSKLGTAKLRKLQTDLWRVWEEGLLKLGHKRCLWCQKQQMQLQEPLQLRKEKAFCVLFLWKHLYWCDTRNLMKS